MFLLSLLPSLTYTTPTKQAPEMKTESPAPETNIELQARGPKRLSPARNLNSEEVLQQIDNFLLQGENLTQVDNIEALT